MRMWRQKRRARDAARPRRSLRRARRTGAGAMWPLRAAVRRGLWLFPQLHGPLVPRAAAPLTSRLGRVLATLGRRGLGGPGGHGDGRQDREGEEEALEEQELLRKDPLLPSGAHRVFLVHPDFQRGPTKQPPARAEWQVAEAEALVRTLDGWSVVETAVVPVRTPGKKLIFGKGALEQLTAKIRGCMGATAVFLNVERLATPTQKELEATWGVQVLDRFTLVLHIFRCNARTREARLQVALAELPLLRSNLRSDVSRLGGRGGSSRCIMGSGESFLQLQQRLLREKEGKIQKALERLRRKRQLLGRERQRREFPVVSLVGYTNSGKTTLVRALTGDSALRPRDQLFATLDVTAHAGVLPSRLMVLYMDTIGFLSQLPHSLIQSFSATLQDVAQSDVIVHVRDVSHPDTELQKASVLSTLCDLCLPSPLLASVLEVHNKVDLVPGYCPVDPRAVAVSALLEHGLEDLKARLEDAVLTATGRRVLTLRVQLQGPQLSWLHTEATVQEVDVHPEAAVADVKVIITNSAYGKFRKLFPA
ncbi:putative GTP-binding protein 6 [Erinaceus europaeus]|uniref:GTP-binding protein 6 n=1 Tax=Erinaceus europaeus TaxID=9365 RepID=A0ABM3W0C4_ERIEU|nr:putative GTP-binding protein 6 [Erinaceus europaeus]